ncbi:hypothetical protein GF323_02465 [Candidatus Woesearchaeota archaeon]|nr:hypothetical protein [Candidatus Woesearchaeota archaeon]
MDLDKLQEVELLTKYNELYEQLKRFHALTFDIDALDIVLEEKMKEKLQELMEKKHGNYKTSAFNSKYSLITTPVESSIMNLEKLEILKIAADLKNKKLLELDSNIVLKKMPEDIMKRIKGLVSRFWWITLSWTEKTEKNELMYVDEIKKIIQGNTSIADEIKELNNYSFFISKEKKELAKELSFDKEMDYYLKIFEKYAVFHDMRKEGQMKGTAAMNKFLFEVSRRYGQKYNDLVWCWPWEIISHIKTGEIDLDEINKRKESYFFLVTEERIEQHTGIAADRRRNEELMAGIDDVLDFKGVIASAGRVTGKAKVCFASREALNKVNKGDILVASMTTPDYLPAMKKAVAVVTDEGGVTCHAAIVSRELKVPCIVGCKIATRTLKDGDLIEVNANHGTVKIVKRA